ncbi:MAG TPA: M50 family metallopeptidase [bacterium]|nr:M50 family metallopeptidase [bacterium]
MDLALQGKSSRVGLVLTAAGALILEHFVPFGGTILYPFTLLATWVHEMGHGLGALLVGGEFDHLEIFRDASGLAWTAVRPGWREAWVCAAGLLDPPFAGALILALARGPKRGGAILLFLSAALILSVLVWVRSVIGVVSMLPLSLVLAGFGLYGGAGRTMLAQLVGVLLALDTVARIDYLFMSSATIGGTKRVSDVGGIAAVFGMPVGVWGVGIAALSFALLYLGLRVAWARND